jgi:predicted MFS family arabinose efflux permease
MAAGAAAPSQGNLLNEFKEGVRYVGATPMILASTIAAYVISIFVGTYTRFLAVFAKDVLHVGPDGMGLLVAAPGVGAVLSLIVLNDLESRWSREPAMVFSQSYAVAVDSFLHVAKFMVIGCPARFVWRHADHLSHRQPLDYSS